MSGDRSRLKWRRSDIDWHHIIQAAAVSGVTLTIHALMRAFASDTSRRISSTLWSIRAFDKATRRLLRDPVWSGQWESAWAVKSATFASTNVDTGRLYRCFNSVALRFSGTTNSGHQIPYAFVGKLSRDRTILTGTWFDSRGGSGGYHGAFQIRVQPDGHSAAGQWLGFSEATKTVKTGGLSWRRIRDV